MDVADGDDRVIVLKYMPDGTIAIDGETDPSAIEKYRDQINAIVEATNKSPFLRPIPSLKHLFAGKDFRDLLKPARYSPCIDCGNPAKGGHCFKCQKKKRAA